MDELLAGLPPEVLQQLLSLSTSNDQMGLLQGREAQANDAMHQPAPQHSTGAGGAWGALAQGLGGVAGGLQTHQLQGQQDQLLGLRQSQLGALLQLLRAPKAQPSPMGDFDADDMGGGAMMG